MAGGHADAPGSALTAAGAVVLMCSVSVLSACSSSPAEHAAPVRAAASSATTDAAAKAKADQAAAARAAAAEQNAAVKAAAQKFVAKQKARELAASRSHPVAKAAAACGVPLAYVYAGPTGSRIGNPDVPKPGDIWRVKATSPVSPGMIIYWPDGGSPLCR